MTLYLLNSHGNSLSQGSVRLVYDSEMYPRLLCSLIYLLLLCRLRVVITDDSHSNLRASFLSEVNELVLGSSYLE